MVLSQQKPKASHRAGSGNLAFATDEAGYPVFSEGHSD